MGGDRSMRLEYWIAARIGMASMRLTGRRGDTIKQVRNCQRVSDGEPLPGMKFHDTQEFSQSMWLRAMFASMALGVATGGVDAAMDQLTRVLHRGLVAVAVVWVGLAILSIGEVGMLQLRLLFTFHSLDKDAPRSYARPLTKGHGLPRPYDFWIGALLPLGFLALLFITNAEP